MEELVLEVERRTSTGKGANKKLRREGLIPAVVYGGGKDTVPVVIDRHAITELLRQETGLNTVFLLKMKGTKQQRHAMLREVQIDPVTRQFKHLDFIRVMKGQLVQVDVPVQLEGEAAGAKAGGFLNWVARTIKIECPADSIPAHIVVDISSLDVGEHIEASTVELPDGAKLIEDSSAVVVTIETKGARADEEEEEAEAAEALGAEEAEPELVRRRKGEEDEEESE